MRLNRVYLRWFVLPLTLCLLFLVSLYQIESRRSQALFWGGVGEKAAQIAQNPASPRTVSVHLFEWKWTDIAQECETFLGPKGYAGIQVSPPTEHRLVENFPWYQRYQPVSYKLESRSGTRAEFAEMVARCRAVGVDIYVDAVINHMTGVLPPGETEVGNAGSPFGHFEYPLYQFDDFNHCNRNPDNEIRNWNDRWEVQHCKLLNLADLKTSDPTVRQKIATYLNDLTGLGVAGFRIDAAKHIPATDLQAILSQVRGNPLVYQEVIASPGEPIQSAEYFPTGLVTEFQYSRDLARVFRDEKLAYLREFGSSWGMIPSDKAVVFTNNHDNQRGHGDAAPVLTFKDGKLHELATIFMLAWPYGYPQIMSSYAFETDSQGPPSDSLGNTRRIYGRSGMANCGREWICEHRHRAIANMVGFRNSTHPTPQVRNWWSNENNQIAFSVGDRGFVAINREDVPLRRRFQTGLPAGTYCNAIAGELTADRRNCTGDRAIVDAQGYAEISVPPMSAVAIHGGEQVQS
ncbi:alpha amylase C-terminal domain-containing protein [Desertifilum sp. FACHB-1129]|uniref:Alpha-amylase n=1 Tax=Desertifilum tharense IPPAS B-1220 TaxID=1781255 RepID=A0A1E5QHS2_9CYAN|nr:MULTISPECIES: alpha-amylase family protein [Desertifilum]MDA0211327.1 alpha-amylase family glycosyl hydrolase [Cyanobacteria bacterium FC1]MBD2314652.1 alpha amylase C-terminal domain-containing protein [Desertifilum sp. FACHB-1129]MBD2320288.1 alpha amylase C-terminal domain-containing protein [Desertifilum sp. FACHB-866]MBD2330416.1 alpha amylase C-terminal domain-containing protein [Desertifilum sp. FACHB-868]OEJ74161.1 ATPase [Desertifilum tharense IPPAS B-1220]